MEWLRGNLMPEDPAARKVTIFVHGKNHPMPAPAAGAAAPLGLGDVRRLKAVGTDR